MKQPKTIADLKFNWAFDHEQGGQYYDKSEQIFKNLNIESCQFNILPGKYIFYINNNKFPIYMGIKQSLCSFILHEQLKDSQILCAPFRQL